MTTIVAMWSGPRNISTAMMRSWDARGDTRVVDEPRYAHYRNETGLDHPVAAKVVEHGETDLDAEVRDLTTPRADDPALVYQKHMTHHVLPGMDVSWALGLRNAMLIREPREMLTSLLAVLPNADLHATGLPQQIELFDRLGGAPVVDSRDVLENPRGMLGALCGALGVPFTDRMLSWPAGPRDTAGVWAEHWYASVNASTRGVLTSFARTVSSAKTLEINRPSRACNVPLRCPRSTSAAISSLVTAPSSLLPAIIRGSPSSRMMTGVRRKTSPRRT